MTLYQTFEARCDRCGRRVLVRDTNGKDINAAEAGDHLIGQFWRLVDGEAFCPACVASAPPVSIETVEVAP